ncbi:MAG: carboxypeptidase regulatory-like domain-containing protein [Gammaproteobacteria bacterium]|nr:carboxypeptidase regulatory-like domain-containing protein [Gammaproteobacteria bacterium]
MRHTHLLRNLRSLVFCLLFSALLFSQNSFARPSFEEKDISDVGWSVTLVDVMYDAASNTTSFVYSLDADENEKDLSHWVLAIDFNLVTVLDIVPSTLTSYGFDPTTSVYGIKWDAGQDSGTNQIYTVVVAGNSSIVDMNYSVKGGTYFAVGQTQGPGESGVVNETNYSISGSVYVDANLNVLLDVDEPLVANVTVELFNQVNLFVASTITDSNGQYIFNDLQVGDYTVKVPSQTISEDFNEQLNDYFSPSSSTAIDVSINDSDVSGINFGYNINTTAILNDLDTSDPDVDGFSFPGSGKTIGYWKHQLSVAIKGKGRAHVSEETMRGYISEVESFLLVHPFQFNSGVEFEEAFYVMANRTSVSVELLKKQLLGTEFNYMAGLGLSGDYVSLQYLILAWSEYLAANHSTYTREELLLAKDILDQINNMGH